MFVHSWPAQLLPAIGGIEVLENACRVDAVFGDILTVAKLISWLTREPNAMSANVLSRREVAMLLAMWNMQDAATVKVGWRCPRTCCC